MSRDWDDLDRSLIPQQLRRLLADAERLGLKIRVWLEPQEPLAMGNHVMRYEVRPAQYPVVETHTEKFLDGFPDVRKSAAAVVEAAKDLADGKARLRIDGLEALCGYVENGTDRAVTVFQDNRSEWVVRVGNHIRYGGETMREALDAAIAGEFKI